MKGNCEESEQHQTSETTAMRHGAVHSFFQYLRGPCSECSFIW